MVAFTFVSDSPITICGFLAKASDWDIESIPPTITAAETKQTHNGDSQSSHWASAKPMLDLYLHLSSRPSSTTAPTNSSDHSTLPALALLPLLPTLPHLWWHPGRLLLLRHSPHCTPMEDPRASNCSEIWKASSRVGVRTKANKRWGVSSSAFRMGKAKAPVFPDPVSANPMISRPEEETATKP